MIKIWGFSMRMFIDVPDGIDQERIDNYRDIFLGLIKSGGLDGVKGGRTIIHFDQSGKWRNIELDYFPYWNRELNV